VIQSIKTFFSESYRELTQEITWPTFSELQSSATVVLVASLIFALMVGAVDVVFEKSMTWFYQSF